MFRISKETFGLNVVYSCDGKDHSISALEDSGIDKISVFFFEGLSVDIPSLKPCRVSLGVPQDENLFIKLSNIEHFLFQETQTHLRKQNKEIADKTLKNLIQEEIVLLQNLSEVIDLPTLVKKTHERLEKETNSEVEMPSFENEKGLNHLLAKRSLLNDLYHYISDLHNEPIKFSVTFDGKIVPPDAENAFPMQMTSNRRKILINPIDETPPEKQLYYVRLLQQAIQRRPGDPLDCAAILKKKIESTVENEYRLIPTYFDNKRGNSLGSDMNLILLNDNHYIASSFPYDHQVFWETVFDQDVGLIVKLTGDKPDGFRKLYWPNYLGETHRYSNFLITLLHVETLDNNLIKRIFELTQGDHVRQVTHLDFLGWPDMKVPIKADLENLLAEVDKACPQSSPDNRILVHCLGGVGRTGTLIAAHAAKKTPLKQFSNKLVYDLVVKMREQRPRSMVETSQQYLLAWQIANQQ